MLPPAAQLDVLHDSIGKCLCINQINFQRQFEKLQHRLNQHKPADRLFKNLQNAVEISLEKATRRKALIPLINYPEDLPIAAKREDIKALIKQHQVVVIAGETGSGKTTQLPKICLELGRGAQGIIGHTQPRRIAARTVAGRIAEELGDELGNKVGYQVRFNDHTGENTLVKLMTDGILLAEIQRDSLLQQYDTLIIDEAHERSLNIDFLLGYLKHLLLRRPDLKVIITSATIDVEKFSKHFSDAPILEVSGRSYPVEVIYREPKEDQDLPDQIADTLAEIFTLPKRGDVLVFLSGEREIREVAGHLRHCQFPHLEVVPLYARLSLAEQTKVFQPHKGVRVVLATNVAETSLTVPGIRYVIDPGYCRMSRYSYRTKVQRLPIEAISQASANQRKGRCGRVSEGVCYRLYSEQDFLSRPEFTDPEILRTNLASVILQMLQMNFESPGLGDIREFPFIDKPDNRLINDGFNLLSELGAINDKGQLTQRGSTITAFPLDPRLSTMLVVAAEKGALAEMLVIVSALSIQDPRERPADKQQAADEKHRQWQDKESDFVTLLTLWQHLEQQRQELSRNQFEKYCRQQFISPLRMREWRDLHHQIHQQCRKSGLKGVSQPASYPAIHQAILTGFLTQIGQLQEGREFLGTRNRKFLLFPASGLAKKPPKWVVSGEMVETSRLYAHFNASIDPQWLPQLAAHLVKKTYTEPHYSVRQGQVVAYEKQTLLGLAIVQKKLTPYGKLDPAISREIFIRAALVEGLYRGKGAFLKHNQQLIKELEELESRFRRQDILVDDEAIFNFYNQRIADQVVNLAGFEKWRKSAEADDPKRLYLTKSLLADNLPGREEQAQFPDQIRWQGVNYQLSYHFEPGSKTDGVTVTIPVSLLHQTPLYRFEWLVPGLLKEKIIALVKGLPKSLRRHFVPVPDYVEKILPDMLPDDIPITQALGHQLQRHTALEIPEESWQQISLEDYYKMNFRLVDDDGKELAMGRDLTALRKQYKKAFTQTVNEPDGNSIEQGHLTGWNFVCLPEVYLIKKNNLSIRTYPALVVEEGSVALRLLDTQDKAAYHSRTGLAMLARTAYPQDAKYLGKQLLKGADLTLTAAGLGLRDVWVNGIIQAAYQQVFKDHPFPRTKQDFEAIFSANSNKIVGQAQEFEHMLIGWFESLIKIRQMLREVKPNAIYASQSIEAQIKTLCYPSVFVDTPIFWLKQMDRYLKAIINRLEKLPGQVLKDRQYTEELDKLMGPYQALSTQDRMSVKWVKEVLKYRFWVEEYRVSLFAQQLKTAVPVSGARLKKQWQVVEKLFR